MTTNHDHDIYVSPKAAAKQSGCCLQSLRRWAKDGKIRHYRTPGGHHRYSLESIMKLKASQSTSTPTAVPIAKPEVVDLASTGAVIAIEAARTRLDNAGLRRAFDGLARSSDLAG